MTSFLLHFFVDILFEFYVATLCTPFWSDMCGVNMDNLTIPRSQSRRAIIKSLRMLTRKADMIWTKTDQILNDIADVGINKEMTIQKIIFLPKILNSSLYFKIIMGKLIKNSL